MALITVYHRPEDGCSTLSGALLLQRWPRLAFVMQVTAACIKVSTLMDWCGHVLALPSAMFNGSRVTLVE